MEITIKGKPEEVATLLSNLVVGTPQAIKFTNEGVTLTPYIGKLQGVETPLKGDATVFHKNSKITQVKGE